ncbi:MAG TPA: helix-turn-helix domain-containing protein [Streptosporangiaceae bacterium]|jgi:AcrR family transcriptional regulator
MTPETGRPLRADARRNRARVLEAAEAVFSAKGAAASTEEIARTAGVGVGTVFRHFPTKKDLVSAIMTARLERLFADADALIAEGDPATALFTFFTRMVEQAASKKTVVEALGGEGFELDIPKPIEALRQAVGALLAGAQRVGAVRADAAVPEVMALLSGACRAALDAEWSPDLQARTLAIVFDGLRPGRRR